MVQTIYSFILYLNSHERRGGLGIGKCALVEGQTAGFSSCPLANGILGHSFQSLASMRSCLQGGFFYVCHTWHPSL
jgi:hypothetical protein